MPTTKPTESVEDLYASHQPATGSGQFFALKDGETKRVRIQSEPYVYRDVFHKEGEPDKISTRFAWLIFNHDEKRAQILKQSGTFYSSLATLVKNPDYGNPTEYDVHIARAGTGTDTKYTVNGARKNIDLTAEDLGEVVALDILVDAKEPTIMSLRDYKKNGEKFPDEAAKVEADGTPIIQDLDEGENPLDKF